jgi:hypothetical protein
VEASAWHVLELVRIAITIPLDGLLHLSIALPGCIMVTIVMPAQADRVWLFRMKVTSPSPPSEYTDRVQDTTDQ